MNAIELVLDSELRKPAQIIPAVCYLIVLITLMIILPTMMGTYVNGGFKGLEPFDMPEWNTSVVVSGLTYIGHLSLLLCIWVLINSVQQICELIDSIQYKMHIRKWGYEMYAHG